MKDFALFILAGSVLIASGVKASAQPMQQTGNFVVSGRDVQSSGATEFQILPYEGDNLTEVILTLTVTQVVDTGTWTGFGQTPGIPQATLTDSVGLAAFPATKLTVTDNFVGTAPLGSGQTAAYTIASFSPLPASETVDITSDLYEFEHSDGQEWFPPSLSYSSNILNDEFAYPIESNQYTISGTYALQFIAAPEPNSGWLALTAAVGLGCLAMARHKARV